MRKLLDFIRFLIVSPEVIVGLAVYLLFVIKPDIFKFISAHLFIANMEWTDYAKLLGIPLTSLGLTYTFGESILNPQDRDNRKSLKEWPDYWMLKNRIYYSLVISIIALIGSLFSWYYALNVDFVDGTLCLMIFWSTSLVSLLTVSLAKLSIKDILY